MSEAVQHNLAVLHEAVAAAVPHRECIVWRDRRLTWAEVTDRTRRLAAVLGPGRSVDGSPGSLSPHAHVALYLTNGNEYLEGMLGAMKARWAAVNVNHRYRAGELAHVLGDADAAAVIYHGRFAATLAAALPRLPRLRRLLRVDDGSGDDLLPGAVDYEEALAAADPTLVSVPWSPEDRYLLYTGGTTGHPKGVVWRQADFLATCLGVRGTTGELVDIARRATLRALPAPPFMHGAAHWNAISAWLGGGTVVVQDVTHRLDAADVLDTCEREAVTSLLIVGDAFARPLIDEQRRRPRDLSALRFVLTGGAVLGAPVKAALLDLLTGARVVDILGSSETGRHGVTTTASAAEARTGCFAPSATTVVLSGDRRRTLGPGDPEIGWLAQRGRVPLGYLGDPAATAATFPVIDGVRYAVAGDRARLLADGTVELLGRDAATINSGGEKIFAEEVEQAILAHPAVADALVVGRPSERFGHEVVAVVALRDGAVATAEDLRSSCAEHLAGYKLPRAIVFCDAVQRSPSGKADYAWARAQTTR